METAVADFVSRRWSVPLDDLDVRLEPLHGGLESTVLLARIAARPPSPPVPGTLVVKTVPAGLDREADVYEWLWSALPRPPAVRLVGRQSLGVATRLYLEEAGTWAAWPWAETAVSAAVCRVLARLHDEPATTFRQRWNYEEELVASAASTLELAVAARDASGRRCWRRLGDLRRVIHALPAIRGWLLGAETTVIHGDVHPGNVCRDLAAPASRILLIDWGRARLGSPFEDVGSWLHSLGCWEPEARRRHDTLLRAYLDSRRDRRPLTAEVRREYWLASATNGLAGAIRYFLAVAADPRSSDGQRGDARRALSAWQRTLRRAAALLRTSPRR